MNCGDALNAVVGLCSRVRRAGWNGKGMYLTLVHSPGPALSGYIAIKAVDGLLYPWQPSQQDMLAHDWEHVP